MIDSKGNEIQQGYWYKVYTNNGTVVLLEGLCTMFSGGYAYFTTRANQSYAHGNQGIYVEPITNQNKTTNNNMTLAQKLAVALKSEPEKSFIKAGITNVDGTFTIEGQSIFLGYLLKKNGDAFKTDVVDILLQDSDTK